MSATPTSEIEIANLMLARIGQGSVSSIDAPTTPLEDKVALHFAMTRRKLLRAYVFNFSKQYATLTKDPAVTPAFGYASAYKLPNDFIRLLAIGDVTINGDTPASLYDLSNGYIYTDMGDEDDTLNLHYIFDATVVAKWDALFVDLMRVQGAKDLAVALTLKPSFIVSIDSELADVKLQAAAVSGQEKPPRRIQRSRLLAQRRSGRGVDNTRI